MPFSHSRACGFLETARATHDRGVQAGKPLLSLPGGEAMAKNSYWVIRTGPGRGIYISRSTANEHGYTQAYNHGLAAAFETEEEAETYFTTRPTPVVFRRGFIEWFKGCHPFIKYLLGFMILEGVLFFSFHYVFTPLDKQWECDKHKDSAWCKNLRKLDVYIRDHDQFVADLFMYQITALFTATIYEIAGAMQN